MSDFGTGFRKARESLGISLEEIANETRIGTRFLEAIEIEEFQRLPGGVFNRGFIRTFAQHVGLDPNAALAEYDRLVQSDETQGTPTVAHRRFRLNFALYPIVISALVVLIVGFFMSRSSGPGAPRPNTPSAEVASTPILSGAEPVVEAAPEPEPVLSEPAAVLPVQQELALQIAATQETWIRLSCDGTAATEEILQPGATRRYTAQKSIDITIGNASGVALKVNDRPFGSLGGPGEVRTFLLTPREYRPTYEILGLRV